jgi:pimeloyl-ACP methyl ester carboxylesterase
MFVNRVKARRPVLFAGLAALVLVSVSAGADDSGRVLTIDHYVSATSAVPAMAGQTAQIYVRERVQAGLLARGSGGPGRVVLFVHGAGTPAEVAFDVPHEGYSWMAYLAEAGFDVFSVDMSGYGRSTRPAPMNDPCNLSADDRAGLAPPGCEPSHWRATTTIASDWADITAAVDYIRALRGVERVSLVAWSLGGPRAGGWASQHPGQVNRLVLLAPAYGRTSPAEPPSTVPAEGAALTKQSRADFVTNWDRQVGCEGQYEPAVADAVWSEMLSSDPVGATWGPGVRRAPRTTTWGWGQAVVAGMRTPTLMVAAVHDRQVPAQRVRDLYEDLGAPQKVLLDLACTSHNAMWETNRTLLFEASREWIAEGTVEGMESGVARLGYGSP